MANLTMTAYWARKFIKFGGAGIAILLVVQMAVSATISYIKSQKKAEPDYLLGSLNPISFPKKDFEKKQFAFTLPNDKLPVVPKILPVYQVNRPVFSLLLLDEAKVSAKGMGFVTEPVEKDSGNGEYTFRNDIANQNLTVNVLDGSFTMSYPYQTDQLILVPEKIPTKELAIQSASSYLEKGGKLSPDLKEGKKEVSFFRISPEKLEPLTAPNGANLARVDIFRKPIEVGANSYKILPSDPRQATVYALVSGSSAENRSVVEVGYKHSNIDRQIFGTYPIKPVELAQKELTNGLYWPAKDVASKSVSIHNVYLAYFEPNILDKTMQPIYVFEDDKANFVAYISAVDFNAKRN